ncbi:electron transfer flavoprotein subunit beta/FixA family protein [bacterium]|nr:electron transfer flavoprotein subunit beta/FixA family protein [candidate division CSSED10-310 bacterium]
MDIAVVLRQVPDTEAVIAIDPGNPARIVEDDIKWIMNPYDEFAVEAAVSLAEEHDGSVTAVCIGHADAEQVIRTAMAMGVEKGLLIADENAVSLDIISQARIIASALSAEPPDLILCGREFIDTSDDALGAALAEFLSMPHVLNVSALNLDGSQVTVEREIDGGTLRIDMPLPGVLSCQKGLNEPRYPNLMAVRRARTKPLDIRTLADLDISAPALKSRVVRLALPPARTAGQLITDDPETAARKAAAWLQNDARIL